MRRRSLAEQAPGGVAEVHPTAVVDPKARLGKGVRVGPYCVIGENVEIGEGTRVVSHAVLEGWTRIGRDCTIGTGALLGAAPQDLKYSGERSYVHVGDRNVIREYVTIHRSARRDGITRVGNDNFIMAFAHVAHDCSVGNSVTIANLVGLSGHVQVEDFAFLGGMTPIHQNVRIGAYAMVAGGCRVSLDIVPYATTGGEPLRIYGVNRVGLKRRGFTPVQLETVKAAFRVLFWSGLNMSDALDRLKAEMEGPEVARLMKFVEGSKRGVTPGVRVGAGETGGEAEDI